MRAHCVLASLVVCVGCDGSTHAGGVVRTEEGVPLAGAEVRVTLDTRSGRPATTGADGTFEAGIVHQPGLSVPTRLSVTANGYEPVIVSMLGTAEYRCDVKLRIARPEASVARSVPWETVCKKVERN